MPQKKLSVAKASLETARRTPSQERSLQTINTLFQAAAQILEREGETALTTNKVASVAGFSIGTLYQYFPSKDALIQAMGLRVQKQMLDQMDRYLGELLARKDIAQSDPYPLVRQAVHLVLNSMIAKGKNKSLLRLFWQLESIDHTIVTVQGMAEKLTYFFEQIQHPKIKTPTATEIFVITRAVAGLVRYGSLEKSSLLGSDALEEALCKMIFVHLAR